MVVLTRCNVSLHLAIADETRRVVIKLPHGAVLVGRVRYVFAFRDPF